MKKIIIINGLPMSGKDTFIRRFNVIIDRMTTKNVFVYNISSVDNVKEAAELLGYNPSEKNERDRKFLADLKQLAKEYNNHPVKFMSMHIDNFKKCTYNLRSIEVMFLHIREPEEIKEMIEIYPEIITLKIDRPRLKNLTMRTALNEADKHTDEYEYDYIVDNNAGKQKFDTNIEEFINKIFKEDL